ncbi:MAG: phage tail tape measure protein [Burkholderiales bacterium]|nr:MAG: phage tail tape measure protein [Burkholderiales bacterium]
MADKFSLKAVISASASGLLSTLKQVNQATRTTRKYLGDVGSSAANLAGRIGIPLGLISGALAGFSVAGIKQAVVGFADLTGQIDDTARGIGVSGEEWQRLIYLAQMGGVASEEMASSVGRLNKNIAMAAGGKNKELAGLFRRTGISMRGANGQLRSATELLPQVADLFARNQNAAVQARMGNAIFGKSWQSLAPLLNDGSEGIQKLTERYKQLGLGIDESAIQQGAKFGDQLDDLRNVVSSYSYQIAGKLLPVLSPIIERTIQWAAANRGLITTNVSNFIAEMGRNIASIDWNAIVQGVNSLVSEVRALVGFFGGARNALIALVVFMNASAIAAVIGLAGAVVRLIWQLGVMSVTAIPAAIVSLKGLGVAMATAGTKANGLLGLMGKIGVVGAAGFAGWEVGKLLNEWVINPLAQMATGNKDATLGTALYDTFNKDPMAAQRPSIVTPASKARVDGEVKVSFANMPPGMRVEQTKGFGTIPLNLDVGYSSAALGRPY